MHRCQQARNTETPFQVHRSSRDSCRKTDLSIRQLFRPYSSASPPYMDSDTVTAGAHVRLLWRRHSSAIFALTLHPIEVKLVAMEFGAHSTRPLEKGLAPGACVP